MSKFLKTVLWIVILIIIGILFGMVSPGQWLTDQSWRLKRLFNKVYFRNTQAAQNFVSAPFDLKLVHLKNEETGTLETYLQNVQSQEMLPVYEINGTTHVGDIEHRLRGVREEAQKSLEEGGESVLKKLKKLQELF